MMQGMQPHLYQLSIPGNIEHPSRPAHSLSALQLSESLTLMKIAQSIACCGCEVMKIIDPLVYMSQQEHVRFQCPLTWELWWRWMKPTLSIAMLCVAWCTKAPTHWPEVCLLHHSGSLLCLQADFKHHAAFFCIHAAKDLMPG